jgi:hypothetical protein
MKKTWFSTLGSLATLGLAAVMSAQTAHADDEFSAEMVQRGADGKATTAKMYVGDKRMRTEMTHQGQQVVRIVDEARGVEWILFPDQKSYMERRLTQPGGQPMAAEPTAEDPCAGMPGMTCRKLGEETVAGRPVLKWEMVASFQGKTVTSTQWIDKDRGPAFVLRQETSNGQKMERVILGKETIDGRDVEKWKIDISQPGGQSVSTFEWYDPDLKLALKQEYPGGMVSEIKNVRVGKQPDQLFGVPAGYERMSMPAGGGGASKQH